MTDLENSMAFAGDGALRKMIQGTVPAKLEQEEIQNFSMKFTELVFNNPTDLVYDELNQQLTKMYNSFEGLFDFAQVPTELRSRRFINKTGVAISPEHCLHTIKDVYRMSSFMRAVDNAIADCKAKFNEKIHIVYPACGPLAPLILPLLLHYKVTQKYTEQELEITFIDIQPGAIMSLTEVVNVGSLQGYVKDICLMDATDYQKNSRIHMVVLEAMQHGFSREGHLAIAHHFAQILEEDGFFIPESVKVNAVLVNPQHEFVEQWCEVETAAKSATNEDIIKERILLGEVLDVNLEFLQNMKMIEVDQFTKVVSCAHMTLPELEGTEKVLAFCTEVNVYQGEVLNEYESGITHPLPNLDVCINFIPRDKKPDDLYVNSGDNIGFFYRMNGMPGFLVTKEVKNG